MAKKEQPTGDVRARVLVDIAADGITHRANDIVTMTAEAAAPHLDAGALDTDEASIAAALEVFGGRERVHADEVAKVAAAADQPTA